MNSPHTNHDPEDTAASSAGPTLPAASSGLESNPLWLIAAAMALFFAIAAAFLAAG
jgi:hypothetical protein